MAITHRLLSDHGLNLHAIFDIATLPEGLASKLEEPACALEARFRQLHLFGHAGSKMWAAMQKAGAAKAPEPVDSFSAHLVRRYFEDVLECPDYRLLIPGGDRVLPLQKLGELAGWHHASPFNIGVNRKWGSWFAYRAVALATTDLAPTTREDWGAPCEACIPKPCISQCPASALDNGSLDLELCIDYRLQEGSRCRSRCLSREACPVATEHRYSPEQICYHYTCSMQTIRNSRRRILNSGLSEPSTLP